MHAFHSPAAFDKVGCEIIEQLRMGRLGSLGTKVVRVGSDPGLTALMEGVELTERSLLNALEKHGVKKFDPSGEKFDPNFQQAMYEVPDPSVPAGTVVQVVQAGYMIGERVLRPALVGVAKGGAKAAPTTEAAN